MSLFLHEQGIAGLEIQGEEEEPCLVAYFPGDDALKPFERRLKSYLLALEELHGRPVDLGLRVDRVKTEAWNEAWKSHFHASRVSARLVVKPTWEALDPPAGAHILEIDPGQAFGTGLHATTRMCLQWLDELLGEVRTVSRLVPRALDVGTGTGILAIAMARLGVSEVWALDIDPLAVEAAGENARRNGVGDKVSVLEGSLDRLMGRPFPLIVANLTGASLQTMAEPLCGWVAPRGRLLLSGILAEERTQVCEAFEGEGLEMRGERSDEEWRAILLGREG